MARLPDSGGRGCGITAAGKTRRAAPSASEMTYIVSSGALNSTHSLTDADLDMT